MMKIIPHLWFDKEAVEAANWYVSLFDGSTVTGISQLSGTPSGDVDVVEFRLANLELQAISAGPYFRFNSSFSFMVACETAEEVDRLHAALSPGGEELMPLGEYPFSKRYGWLSDRYGLNWQLMLAGNAADLPKIRPVLLFAGNACGWAEDAIDFYNTVFPLSQKGFVSRYEPGEAADARARVNYAEFSAGGLQFVMMDHGMGGDEAFNEAVSFMVLCDTQEDIDRYWGRLSHVPEAEQCGWLKDRFGLSWQIVPANMGELIDGDSREQTKKLTEAFLNMKKIDISALEAIRRGDVVSPAF